MRFSIEDYTILKTAIDSFIEKTGIEKVKEHRSLNLGKDTEKRFRWDLFWGSKYSPDYNKYNDSHIDSALKKYIKERTDISI